MHTSSTPHTPPCRSPPTPTPWRPRWCRARLCCQRGPGALPPPAPSGAQHPAGCGSARGWPGRRPASPAPCTSRQVGRAHGTPAMHPSLSPHCTAPVLPQHPQTPSLIIPYLHRDLSYSIPNPVPHYTLPAPRPSSYSIPNPVPHYTLPAPRPCSYSIPKPRPSLYPDCTTTVLPQLPRPTAPQPHPPNTWRCSARCAIASIARSAMPIRRMQWCRRPGPSLPCAISNPRPSPCVCTARAQRRREAGGRSEGVHACDWIRAYVRVHACACLLVMRVYVAQKKTEEGLLSES